MVQHHYKTNDGGGYFVNWSIVLGCPSHLEQLYLHHFWKKKIQFEASIQKNPDVLAVASEPDLEFRVRAKYTHHLFR